MLKAIFNWTVASSGVWLVSTTIARARVFEGVRQWVKKRSSYWYEGIACQYCVSHWVALALVVMIRTDMLYHLTRHAWSDMLVTWAAWCAGSNILARTLGRADEKTTKENIHT